MSESEGWRVHPLAERFFPMMTTAELTALAEDIAANGQQEPIILFHDQILDGRNRAAACQQRGLTPTTTTFAGSEEEAAALVMSRNRLRRHLTTAQKAMAEAEYRAFYQERAQGRMHEGQQRGGEAGGKGRPKHSSSKKSDYSYNSLKKEEKNDTKAAKPPQPHRWADDAAAAAGVSHDYIYKAKRVLESGDAALIAQVKAGTMSLSKASAVLKPTTTAAAPASRKAGRPRRRSPHPVEVPHDPHEPLARLQYWWHLATPSHRDTFLAWILTLEATYGTTHPLLHNSPRLSPAAARGAPSAPAGPAGKVARAT